MIALRLTPCLGRRLEAVPPVAAHHLHLAVSALPVAHHQLHFRKKSLPCCRAAPSYNPQNTDQAQTQPSPAFSAEQTVRVQLDALLRNDDPWPMHGVQTAYEFGYDIGGLDPSEYFGFKKDLYHFDHFMGVFQNKLPELINLSPSYEITAVMQDTDAEGEEQWQVSVVVKDRMETAAPIKFVFYLKRKNFGTTQGALLTEKILRATE